MKRLTTLLPIISLGLPGTLHGQLVEVQTPVIDTVIIVTQNVFTPEQAEKNFAFRFMNGIHVVTKHDVIWSELMFRPGEPADSTVLEESERNLRAREIFQRVEIDTLRLPDGRLAVLVDTQDGWTLKPKFKLTIASDGTWSGQFGLSEVNLLGSGNLAHIAWRQDVDRHGPELIADFRRIFDTRLAASGEVVFWNDGTDGNWRFGIPYLTTIEPNELEYDGEAADRRVLQFRVDDPAAPDTNTYHRSALINRINAGLAPIAETKRYLRFGVMGEVRQEKFILSATGEEVPDSVVAAVPDSVYGVLGIYGVYRQTRFKGIQYFNGFGAEDIDVSTKVRVQANVAPASWGYDKTGIGPAVELQSGFALPNGFLQSTLKANGLFNDAGLDSGQVVLDVTFGLKPAPRHSTAVYVRGGMQENPAPGNEFDLGFEVPPRSWEPHSFVGTRMVWGTIEHRWFVWDALLDLISLGFAAFIDYGGAWYPDQEKRFGGNIGIGLRQGGALSTAARTGRLDLGYRFGEGITEGRWVLTFGAGINFPWKPPTTSPIPPRP
ncbi:MAG: hypothetical protein JSW46_20020 [Gemmatimonadota bacterium]|nr:MAG: hypothetical protein JSW46_20020 [Gemmatimonadota bacterium]